MSSDRELLLLYAQERSETAFAELVSRHIDMVYSAALRVVAGDTHLAQDVAQTVFTDLARKARSLPRNLLLPGWLYRNASFTAAKAVRSEHRRRNREQTAMQLSAIEDHAEPDWERLAPHLDDALNQLNEADRDALVLRFLQRQDFRAVGLALGVSDDAAQKRVTRALEKLRNIWSPAGEKLTVTTLASMLTAGAVTAAPSGLAASITAGSLTAAATVAAGTGLALLKVIPMTKLSLTVAGAVALATVTTPIVVQQRSLTQARQENAALRQQADELTALAEATAQRVAIEQADVVEWSQVRNEHAELLRLRSEVGQLRQQVRLVNAAGPADIPNEPTPPTQPVAEPNATKESMRQLGIAASRGDFSALDKLAEHAAAAMKARTNQHEYVLGDVDDAFDVLGSEAGQGNETAFQALWRATRNKSLDGLAIRALGQAAALGHAQSLEVLLDPEKHLLLRTSTISALRPVAETGNQRAIEALAAVAAEEKSRPLWYIVATGLEKAAIAGNATAIDAMAVIARSSTNASRKVALLALENAAFQNHSRATEALRGVGYP